MAPERRIVETFTIYTPKINHEVKEVITIADLIPEGRENAISRAMLTAKCVRYELIDKNTKDKDRAMRNLVNKARIDWTILNLSDGDGYYRPTHEDLLELRRYIRQEENRGKAIFKNLQNAKKLYEDLMKGRLEQ